MLNREHVHRMLAMEAGRLKAILPDETMTWPCLMDDEIRSGGMMIQYHWLNGKVN